MNKNPLILIVEDEEAISSFISTLLTSNDYSILKTASGQDAITLAASYCPDLILLDLGLPDVSGTDVIESIRAWSAVPDYSGVCSRS